MPLPRNAKSKNSSTRNRNAATKEITKKTNELDFICEKHKIGNLSFRSCKYATAEGKVTFVDHSHVRGNMKSGIMIISAHALTPLESVYDIVEIEKSKRERAEKKKEEEMEKARIEIERFTNTNSSLPEEQTAEASDQHKNLLEELENKIYEPNNTQAQTNVDQQTNLDQQPPVETKETTPEILETTETIIDLNENKDITSEILETTTKNNNKDIIPKNPKKDKSTKAKRTKAIKQLQEQITTKANNKNGNKYFRNFMKDIKNKFILQDEPSIKYVEVKAETTDMIIDGVKAYKIMISASNIKETYFLFIGDLQMKSNLIQQIDPTYKVDRVLKDQNDFLERIKAKESVKAKVFDEDLLENDLDDLDELGISDDELDYTKEQIPQLIKIDDSDDNDNDNDDDIITIKEFINPELLKLDEQVSLTNEQLTESTD